MISSVLKSFLNVKLFDARLMLSRDQNGASPVGRDPDTKSSSH